MIQDSQHCFPYRASKYRKKNTLNISGYYVFPELIHRNILGKSPLTSKSNLSDILNLISVITLNQQKTIIIFTFSN